MKVLYGAEFQKGENIEELFDLICAEAELESDAFSKELVIGTMNNLEKIDEAISANAKGWKIERIAKMSLAVMRLCTYELLFTDVPAAIAINEALEIDKQYDSDDAPAYINGILNAISKSGEKN